MSRRYLFGPVTPEFAAQNLRGPRQAGHCVAFGDTAGLDLVAGPADTWESLGARLSADWRPDFVALWLAHTSIPPCLWQAPVPLIGLATRWDLQWHRYRYCLGDCDLVLADPAGVDLLRREGLRHTEPANLSGCGSHLLDGPAAEGPRDIDILFAGNLHTALRRARLPWLARLARLSVRWRVAIRTGAGEDYRALLERARVVFNFSTRGGCNRRAFEAAAAGALLFQEAGNLEVPAYFRDRQEYVCYDEDNLEALLEHYLSHEEERRAVAEAARVRVRAFSFERLWEIHLSRIEQGWEELAGRRGRRTSAGNAAGLPSRCWQALGTSSPGDPALAGALAAAVAAQPQPGTHNAAGLVAALAGKAQRTPLVALAQAAAGHFRQAVEAEPRHVVARLNLAEALVDVGDIPLAVREARQALALLDRLALTELRGLNEGHYPPGYDFFRVEWERAAWLHAGHRSAEAQAKCQLLRWRLHLLLGDLTDDQAHRYEAVVARPDLPTSRAALGCALARAGRPQQALEHLRQAVSSSPFDLDAARALSHVLADLGDVQGQRRFARERLLLSRAASQIVPAEEWFTKGPPVGDELASLVVLCCNEVRATRLCLESVLRHTRPPYELILVDNGSTDDTPALLEEVSDRPGPERVVVIRNAENKGFAAGCNQALAAAKGPYLVLLNNDTVVTPGWLDRLVTWSLHEWPRVGMVGPVTNYAPAPQLVEPAYEALAGLDAFAAHRYREFSGQALRVGRLSGFCLLVRREVLERAGKFDERFGLGFFEDDDLCLRARDAGFDLLVALDTYLHHAGSLTFKGLGIDTGRALAENLALFRQKWGEERAANYRAPAQTQAAPGPILTVPLHTVSAEELFPGSTGRTVTLCMIVRNEEKTLPDCLASVLDLVDNAVINDTGSTDRTREVALAFGPKVKLVESSWPDSFAAARNESLRHATGDWIFWMDADDRLDEPNRQKLRELFTSLRNENAAYTMKCHCLPDPVNTSGTVVDHLRLFRNHPQMRWEYRVHEQILPAVRRLRSEVRWADVVITHTGYADPALRARKLERDLRLLQMDLEERPDEPFCLFNLGSILQEQGQHADAIPVLRRSLEQSDPSASIVRKLYSLIAACHRALGQHNEALAACREGRVHCPGDAELLFAEAQLLAEQGSWAEAEACCVELLSLPPGHYFASVDAGLRGYKGRHLLAVIYHRQGRHDLAKAQWGLVVSERPDLQPAWQGLGETS